MQTLRVGGKSEGKYNSFNLATHVNDDIDLVNSNRELLDQFLPSSPHWLNQTHSVDVIEIPWVHASCRNYRKIQNYIYQDLHASLQQRICNLSMDYLLSLPRRLGQR